MCVWAAVAVTAASALMSTVSAYNQAKSDNQALEYNAEAALHNAENEQAEAAYARGQALRNAAEKRRETGQLIGAQRAKMGASGAVVDSGSFMDVLANTAEQGERSAMALMQQGEVEAWRHEVQAGNYQTQARIYLGSKKDATAAAIGSALSGAAQVGSAAYGASQFSVPAGKTQASPFTIDTSDDAGRQAWWPDYYNGKH